MHQNPNDYPMDEVIQSAVKKMEAGWDIYQKATCAQCHARMTVEKPNTFYTSVTCETCGHVTDVRERGCNYMAVFSCV